jgi:DNA-directed RNA polymerase subunit RPC12/RpoP
MNGMGERLLLWLVRKLRRPRYRPIPRCASCQKPVHVVTNPAVCEHCGCHTWFKGRYA